MGTEAENYKKSILKEQEHNEQLTLLHKKIESDIGHVKKQMELIAVKIENLQMEYSTYTRALQETEQALTVASGVSRDTCIVHVHVDIYTVQYLYMYIVVPMGYTEIKIGYHERDCNSFIDMTGSGTLGIKTV